MLRIPITDSTSCASTYTTFLLPSSQSFTGIKIHEATQLYSMQFLLLPAIQCSSMIVSPTLLNPLCSLGKIARVHGWHNGHLHSHVDPSTKLDHCHVYLHQSDPSHHGCRAVHPPSSKARSMGIDLIPTSLENQLECLPSKGMSSFQGPSSVPCFISQWL